MARKTGQIIGRAPRTWAVPVYVGRSRRGFCYTKYIITNPVIWKTSGPSASVRRPVGS